MSDNNIESLISDAKKISHYRELYRGIGASCNFSKLPFLEESSLRTIDFDSILHKNTGVCVYFTSGTTSEPKALYNSINEIAHVTDYLKWFCEVEGIAGNERVAVLMGQSFWGAGYFTSQGHIKAGNAVTPIDTGLSKETVVDLLNAFKPTVISTTPSFLLGLKSLLPHMRLKLIETTGEVLDKHMRSQLKKHFHAEVFDAYGLTEGIIGTECRVHDGYHFLPKYVHLEIIHPETTLPLKDGVWGELAMTVLCRSIMPIIRYRTGDICKISHQPCSCGNQSPKIWIKGRKEKSIPLYEGAKVGLKELQKTISDIFGSSSPFDIETKADKNMSTLSITIENTDVNKIKLAKRAIININYETLYLHQAGKLRVVFKKKEA